MARPRKYANDTERTQSRNERRRASYTKSDRVNDGQNEYNKQQSEYWKQYRTDKKLDEWRNRPFIAIDGEGEDNATGVHHYTMVTASSGEWTDSLQNRSLATTAIFDFLLHLKRKSPRGIFCGFSLNYDINMALRDVPLAYLRYLAESGTVRWGKYRISWIPGKIFSLSEYRSEAIIKDEKPLISVRVYDVFGFFQTSFIYTLEKWGIGTEAERAIIREMKAKRGIFAQEDKNAIHDYNTLECVLLVQLMNKLREALDTAGLYLKSWHGAGAVGGELLSKHKIPEHILKRDDIPTHIDNAIMCAYFGGRFENKQIGDIGDCFAHDIRSAYPAAFLDMPSLKHGEWREVNAFQENEPWSLWYVQWNVNGTINPFPHRHKRRVSYPPSGEGYYWFPEVQAALVQYPTQIKVLRGYVFTPHTNARPFCFLTDTYVQRAVFKEKKNNAEKVLKLGMNSVYGKTAQGSYGERTPAFQSYIWAGYCTSICRSRIFSLAMRNPSKVVAFATDGVFATERLTTDEEEVNELGQWERTRLTNLFWAQSGVYYCEIDGEPQLKTRGLGKAEIDFAKLRNDFTRTKGVEARQTVRIRRFFGLQYCLHTNRMDLWRKWSEIEKTIDLYPNSDYSPGKYQNGIIRLDQHGYAGIPSEPYVPKGQKTLEELEEKLDDLLEADQPLLEE